jgi:hypothetical protein
VLTAWQLLVARSCDEEPSVAAKLVIHGGRYPQQLQAFVPTALAEVDVLARDREARVHIADPLIDLT